jgi:hypothetical protein
LPNVDCQLPIADLFQLNKQDWQLAMTGRGLTRMTRKVDDSNQEIREVTKQFKAQRTKPTANRQLTWSSI